MAIYLDEYKTFDSKQELNYHVKQHERAHTETLNVTDRSVLRLISRYSVKYAGASHLKQSTISRAVEKSTKQVGRILSKFERLSIINRTPLTRPKTGGRGADIIQILPHVSERMSDREVDEKCRHNDNERHKTKKEPLYKRYNYITVPEAAESVRNAIPSVIYDTLNPFFNGIDLRRIVGVIFRAKKHKIASIQIENHADEFKSVMLDVIRRYKEGTVRNIDGYMYQSIKRLTRRLFLGISETKGFT